MVGFLDAGVLKREFGDSGFAVGLGPGLSGGTSAPRGCVEDRRQNGELQARMPGPLFHREDGVLRSRLSASHGVDRFCL